APAGAEEVGGAGWGRAAVRVRAEGVHRGRASWARVVAPRSSGAAGMLLAILALWVALRPVTVRSVLLPVLLAIVAIAAGIWAFSRGERRVGGGAIAAALVAVGGALLATHSHAGNLEGVFVWGALIAATFRWATPLTFAALGGM